jgi:hypothetical protein
MAVTTRYTAVIKVIKVTEHEGTGRGDDKSFDAELASIIVRNQSLSGLIDKTKKHLDLVDEEGK